MDLSQDTRRNERLLHDTEEQARAPMFVLITPQRHVIVGTLLLSSR